MKSGIFPEKLLSHILLKVSWKQNLARNPGKVIHVKDIRKLSIYFQAPDVIAYASHSHIHNKSKICYLYSFWHPSELVTRAKTNVLYIVYILKVGLSEISISKGLFI